MKRKPFYLLSILLAVFIAVSATAVPEKDYTAEFAEMSIEDLVSLQDLLAEIINQKRLDGATLQFNLEQSSVAVGKSLKLSVVSDGREITTKTKVSYESSDPEIARIQGAQLTGVAEGTAEIKAMAVFEDGAVLESMASVSVFVPVTSVKAPATIDVFADGDLMLKDLITIVPENATEKKLLYATDDGTIATVSEDGILHGVSGGTTSLTITSAEDTAAPKSVKCKINVTQAVSSVALETDHLTVGKQKSATLKATVGPESATNKKLTWESANPQIASVSQTGTVTGVKTGTTTVTCVASDGSNISASCVVTVIQSVSGLTLSQTNITLGKDRSITIYPKVTPEDATNKAVRWSSSNPSIVSVENGILTANEGGDCEITCITEEGEKKAVAKVHVPTFSVDRTEYTVTSKSGLSIPVYWATEATLYLTDNGGTSFDADWGNDNTIMIYPLKAGSGTIIINNNDAPRDKVTIKIHVDHSAVYDTTSYPKLYYDGAARYPDSYKGDKCSFSGKVLQVISGSSTTSYRISSRGNYNDVVYVTINNSDLLKPVLEDDKVTVYGKCNGDYSYTTIFGANMTIPCVLAERINVK